MKVRRQPATAGSPFTHVPPRFEGRRSARSRERRGRGLTHSSGHFWVLALGSIGVVFGDIGTSPLYALQTALGQFKGTALGPVEVIGVVSLIIWALLIVVTAKYVLFLMQADNKGEGGILSLKALAQRALGQRTTLAFLLGVAGSALFSGDAIITPAISVLSALEGLKQVDVELAPYVLPATVVILVVLFGAQSRGTAEGRGLLRPDHGGLLRRQRRARPRAYRFGMEHFGRSEPVSRFGLHPRPWRDRVHRARQPFFLP